MPRVVVVEGKDMPGGCVVAWVVLLCFISTDAGGIGYRGLTQGSPHPNCFCRYFRPWLRQALFFLTDHSRKPPVPVLLSEVQSGGGESVFFGLWRVHFTPVLVRPDRRRLVYFSIAHRPLDST